MKKNLLPILNLLVIAVLTYLVLSGRNDNTNTVETVQIDTAFVKKELQSIAFDVTKNQNIKTVYVTQKQIERFYNEKQPVNSYYYDSTTIVNELNEAVLSLKETTDTIRNKDGVFTIRTLSEKPLFGLFLDYQLNQIEITKTLTKTELQKDNPKLSLFVGIGTGFGSNGIGFSNEFQIQKNKNAFRYSYDYINKQNNISYLFKIR